MRPSRPPLVAFDAVVDAARNGEQWAWTDLFNLLAGKVGGYLRLQGVRDIDDLVSEVFMCAYRNIEYFDGNGAQFRSWLFVIAHHRLIDERRRRTRLPLLSSLQAVPFDVRGRDGDAEDNALALLSTQRVIDLCGELAPDQRDVLLLRLVADMTIDAVADAVDKSPGAVKALQRRGLMALNRKIVRQGVTI